MMWGQNENRQYYNYTYLIGMTIWMTIFDFRFGNTLLSFDWISRRFQHITKLKFQWRKFSGPTLKLISCSIDWGRWRNSRILIWRFYNLVIVLIFPFYNKFSTQSTKISTVYKRLQIRKLGFLMLRENGFEVWSKNKSIFKNSGIVI